MRVYSDPADREDDDWSDWAVVVGNIGTVYSGPDESEARSRFAEYTEQSRTGYGRAAGEPVVLMRDGDPVEETVADALADAHEACE